VKATVIAMSVGTAACGEQGGDRTADGTITAMAPLDGADVAWPATLEVTTDGVKIEPVGDGEIHPGAGHVHVMVDTDCVNKGDTIPKDATHLHFGTGSTTPTLSAVPPGEHELCVQVADSAHVALDSTTSLKVTVGEVTEQAWVKTASAQCATGLAAAQEPWDRFAHPEVFDGDPETVPDAAAVEEFWATAQEVFELRKSVFDGVLALPYPAGADAKTAHDALASGWATGLANATAMLDEKSAEVLASFEFEGPEPFVDLNAALGDLGLEDCIQ
jgi:hypothetical protein